MQVSTGGRQQGQQNQNHLLGHPTLQLSTDTVLLVPGQDGQAAADNGDTCAGISRRGGGSPSILAVKSLC